jgi:hypothetical protein
MWYFKNKRTTVAQNPNAGETAWQRTQRLLSGNATYFDYPVLPQLLNLDTGKPITQNPTYLDTNRAAQTQNSEQNSEQNYEYFSKFPDFDPSDPDSFKIHPNSDPWGIEPDKRKTVRQIKLEGERYNLRNFGIKPEPKKYTGKFESRLTPVGREVNTFYEPKIYWDFATRTFDDKLATLKNNAMALSQTLMLTTMKMKENLETPGAQNVMLQEIKNDLLKVAPAESQENMQQQQQLHSQITTKLYQDGMAMIQALKKKNMPNEEIKKDILDTKLLNLLNSGQINQRMYNELDIWLTAAIEKN